jgi:hypothetical protein
VAQSSHVNASCKKVSRKSRATSAHGALLSSARILSKFHRLSSRELEDDSSDEVSFRANVLPVLTGKWAVIWTNARIGDRFLGRFVDGCQAIKHWGDKTMVKKVSLCAAAFILLTGMVLAGQADKAGTWSGFVTDSICGAKNAGPAGASCTKECVSKKGAKLALYDSASKKAYILDPQEKATGHEGHNVTVTGTLDKDGNTIHVTSLSMSKASGM